MKACLAAAALTLFGLQAIAQGSTPDLYAQAREAFNQNDCKKTVSLMRAFMASPAYATSTSARKQGAEQAIAYCTGTTSSQSLGREVTKVQRGEAEVN